MAPVDRGAIATLLRHHGLDHADLALANEPLLQAERREARIADGTHAHDAQRDIAEHRATARVFARIRSLLRDMAA